MKRYVGKAVFFTVIFFTGANALAERWPAPIAPPNAKIAVVADKMIFNGTPMKAWEISIPESPDEVLSYYTSAWAAVQDNGSPGYKVERSSDWTIVSRLEGEFFITLQIPSAVSLSTDALFGVTHIAESREIELGRGIPLLSQTVVVNDIEADDGPKHSRTIVARSDQRLMENYRFYKRYFSQQGYAVTAGPYPKPEKGQFAVMMNKGRQEVNLALSADGRSTNIVWVSVEH